MTPVRQLKEAAEGGRPGLSRRRCSSQHGACCGAQQRASSRRYGVHTSSRLSLLARAGGVSAADGTTRGWPVAQCGAHMVAINGSHGSAYRRAGRGHVELMNQTWVRGCVSCARAKTGDRAAERTHDGGAVPQRHGGGCAHRWLRRDGGGRTRRPRGAPGQLAAQVRRLSATHGIPATPPCRTRPLRVQAGSTKTLPGMHAGL